MLIEGKTQDERAINKANEGIDDFLKKNGLAQYQDSLVDMGFDDMEALLAIEEEDLDDLTPKIKRGHRRKLLAAIRVIKGDESDSDNSEMEASMSDSSSSSSSSSGSDSESDEENEDEQQEGKDGQEEKKTDEHDTTIIHGASMALKGADGKAAAAVSENQ